ncbi:MAG: hypothetical protein OEN23_00480 [Paracoccaceae bacterium]|nr:hypothetical protein [Paracoccaceae bacterium]
MSELENAIDRLGRAIANLRDTTGGRPEPSIINDLTGERNELRAEVIELRGQHEQDAQLRVEAADAVRIALSDLRSIAAVSAKQRKSARKKAS